MTYLTTNPTRNDEEDDLECLENERADYEKSKDKMWQRSKTAKHYAPERQQKNKRKSKKKVN
ncbi:hypothetical protein PsorP6_010896 [Peronosclerospora sorghi]|uniref:Uncharacterized protein n=1 Tax=Peronosclerospora sorghi TaxID=230839 RepID=A0ACC0VXP2_9STRA|nr:hypothetical protein PsorP6_010896 [Peronosclerospora sorghi]